VNNLQKVNNGTKELHIAVRLIVLLLFIDQVSKLWAGMYLSNDIIRLIPHVLQLELVHNTGMAFGLLANGRILFLIVSVLALTIGWRYYKTYFTKSVWFYWAGVLFFAGTLGNFLDRLFYGKVTDFIAFRFGQFQFPVFNFADTFLCISVLLALIAVVLEERQWEEKK